MSMSSAENMKFTVELRYVEVHTVEVVAASPEAAADEANALLERGALGKSYGEWSTAVTGCEAES